MFNPIYLATKSSRSKKGATRRTPTPTKKTKTPLWLWLLVAVVAMAFVYGLAQLSQIPSKEQKAASTNTSNIEKKEKKSVEQPKKAKKETTQKTPTTPKKETFEFYQILQDSEVDTSHVDAYQSTPREEQDFHYMLQAASFRSPEEADRMRAKLIISGLSETSIRQTTGQNGQPWYRVTLGPYISRSKMNRAEDKLVSMDISPYSYRVKKEQ